MQGSTPDFGWRLGLPAGGWRCCTKVTSQGSHKHNQHLHWQQVNDALAGWESRALAQRSILEGLVGSVYANAWAGALRTLGAAAVAGGGGQQAAGGGGGGSSAAHQFLDCPPERRLLWRLLFSGRVGEVLLAAAGSGGGRETPEQFESRWTAAVNGGGRHLQPIASALAQQLSAYAAAADAAGADAHAKAAVGSFVKRLARALEKRHRALARDAAGHEVREARWAAAAKACTVDTSRVAATAVGLAGHVRITHELHKHTGSAVVARPCGGEPRGRGGAPPRRGGAPPARSTCGGAAGRGEPGADGETPHKSFALASNSLHWKGVGCCTSCAL